MSLDVHLTGKTEEVPCRCSHCDHEHTRKETEQLYEANITHNLGKMADQAGIYQALWRPDKIGITKAHQLIEPLRSVLVLMRDQPDHFKKLNPENGWGSYDRFVPWIADYLAACEQYPDADVSVLR